MYESVYRRKELDKMNKLLEVVKAFSKGKIITIQDGKIIKIEDENGI